MKNVFSGLVAACVFSVGAVAWGTTCNGLTVTLQLVCDGSRQSDTSGNDVVQGCSGNDDFLKELGGDDTVCLLGGDDKVWIGWEDDGTIEAFMGTGNDHFSCWYGGVWNNLVIAEVWGGSGNDVLEPCINGGTYRGESGNDTYFVPVDIVGWNATLNGGAHAGTTDTCYPDTLTPDTQPTYISIEANDCD